MKAPRYLLLWLIAMGLACAVDAAQAVALAHAVGGFLQQCLDPVERGLNAGIPS